MSDEQLGSGVCISISKSNPQGKQHELITWLVKGGDSERDGELTDDTSTWYFRLLSSAEKRFRDQGKIGGVLLRNLSVDSRELQWREDCSELKSGDRWGR